MISRFIRGALFLAWCCGFALATAAGAESTILELPAPNKTGGLPLMAALQARQSIREFAPRALPASAMSELMWAAFGINRIEGDHRTAPSTMNMQEIDLYVARADGVFVYEPKPHALRRVSADDVRPRTGGKVELQRAPVVLILVADHARMTQAKPADRAFYSAIDSGFISQNAYLYCASAGLATVVHELERAPLAEALQLRSDQKIVIAQSVGYPK